jgi:hypothetical protein
MKKETVNKKILKDKKKAIIEKIEDLNAVQSSLRHRLLDLEKKKNDLSESKYQRHKKKFTKKVEKIRGKIHDLEGKLETIKHSNKK